MNSGEPDLYVGRFAPSPTGPLHFGSLIAAVASYLQARRNDGKWLVRIEDIDPPREEPGADSLILKALERYGLHWDDSPIYQSKTSGAHHDALARLRESGLTYRCGCSRKDLHDEPQGALGTIYPGTCRGGCDAPEFAVRVRVDDEPLQFSDGLQGSVMQRLESGSGDFIVLRRDGLIAYHLAVVVDDFEQGITEIVRGIDLLDSTPRQIYLQRALAYPTPAYLHIPVIVNQQGQKMSKLAGARAIAEDHPEPVLAAALTALRLPVPADLRRQDVAGILAWATEHWEIQRVAGLKSLAEPQSSLA